MLHLWAQAEAPGGFADTIDKLARTPISEIVLFALGATVIRIALHLYLRKVPPHMRSGPFAVAKFGNEAFDAIIYALIFVFLVIRPFGVQAFRIPSGSMLETLQINDFIVANKAIYRYSDPKPGDIVVFKPPTRALRDPHVEQDFIKRCVGGPGDVIEVRDDVLYRNGKAVNEPYVAFLRDSGTSYRRLTEEERRQQTKIDFKLVEYQGKIWPLSITGEFVNSGFGVQLPPEFIVDDPQLMKTLRELPAAPIPSGYFLMMGDNRYGSFDGRFWGLVPRVDIIGRSEFVWLPINRWGVTR